MYMLKLNSEEILKLNKFIKIFELNLDNNQYFFRGTRVFTVRDTKSDFVSNEKKEVEIELHGRGRTLRHLLYERSETTNIYFATQRYYYHFGRHRNDMIFDPFQVNNRVTEYTALYFDIDYNDAKEMYEFTNIDIDNPRTYELSMTEFKNDVLSKILNLKIKPTAIIESRNGYHVYFMIKKEYRKMSKKMFNKILSYINNYLFTQGIYVDKSITDITALRFPYTMHDKEKLKLKKNRKKSKLFRTELIYIEDNKYSPNELYDAFKHDFTKEERILSHEERTHYLDNKKLEDIVFDGKNANERIARIAACDESLKDVMDSLFDLKHYKMSYNNFRKYVKQFNLNVILNIKQYPNYFKCIFHNDNSPSASIFKTYDGVYLYHCFAEYMTLDVIGCVAAIANIKYNDAVAFLAKIFNVEIISSMYDIAEFERIYNENMKVFKMLQDKFKFVNKLTNIYEVFANIYRKQLKSTKISYDLLNCYISARYFSNEMKSSGYASNIKNNFLKMNVLLYLGFFKRIDIVAKEDLTQNQMKTFNFSDTKCYRFTKLNYSDIEQQCLVFEKEFHGKISSVKSIKQLKETFADNNI